MADDAPKHDGVDIGRAFVRLELMLETAAGEERRQFDDLREKFASMRSAIVQVESRQSDTSTAIRRLEARVVELEKRQEYTAATAQRAEEHASGATRRAQDSLHEIESIGGGLMAHLGKLEGVRAAEAAEDAKQRAAAEQARREAAAKHAERFEAQGKAINDLTHVVRSGATLSTRSRWLLGAAIALITVLGNQAIEALKIIYAPRAAAHEVSR